MSTADRPQVFYLWGDDEWSMNRIVASVADGLARDTGAPPDRWRADGKTITADAIGERVQIAPMFGGGTVAVITSHSSLVRSKALREGLESVIASVAPGNALLFLEFDTSSGKKRPKTLIDLEAAVIKSGGTARPCRAPSASEMPSWIIGRANELGVSLDQDAAKEIAKRIGSQVGESDVDRRQLSSIAIGELGKLALYRGTEPVTSDDVRALVAEFVPDSIWALTDAIAIRRPEAGPALDHALETQPEQILLVMLHRRIRELLVAADARAAGGPPPEIVKLVGGSPYMAQKRAEQAAHWATGELEAALDGLLELDRMSKHADAVFSTDGQRRMAWVTWVAACVAQRGRGSDRVHGDPDGSRQVRTERSGTPRH